jgi:large subunit ribosomal protein L3
MLQALLGRKIGMTQIFAGGGRSIPVTVIEAGPCTVTQIKTSDRDGYEAVQIGFGAAKHATRPELGHLGHSLPMTKTQRAQQQQRGAKSRQEARERGETPIANDAEDETNVETAADEAESQTASAPKEGRTRVKKRARAGGGLGPFEIVREVQAQDGAELKVGQVFNASIFADGEEVDVIGTSKGKGFAGVMKRHGFHGGQRTHGQSDRMRAPGSIGAGTTPGRVLKGTRMAGRMGNVRKTIKRLEIVQADADRNLIVIKGSIPGPNGGIVLIRKQVEV